MALNPTPIQQAIGTRLSSFQGEEARAPREGASWFNAESMSLPRQKVGWSDRLFPWIGAAGFPFQGGFFEIFSFSIARSTSFYAFTL